MTTQEIQDEIINEFKSLNSLFDKYVYLVKLGQSLPEVDHGLKTEEHIIKGCQLTTWYYSTCEGGNIFYHIDSSSMIIKGTISLLQRIFSGRRPEEIKNTVLYFIEKIGLQDFFSPIRANSLWKIERQIRQDVAVCEMKV